MSPTWALFFFREKYKGCYETYNKNQIYGGLIYEANEFCRNNMGYG